MAAAVARAFEHGGVLLAEAGTGTGKTLAYLVPSVLSRQRVLVSTGTKNLQEQLFFKDIPTLQRALDVPFTATYMKGRANYLCLHRLDQLNEQGGGPSGSAPAGGELLPRAVHDVLLPILSDWAARTETGDRAELEDLPEDLPFWNEVAATAETCLGSECPRYDDCFITRMRQRAAASDVVIVNHHLLCADAAVRHNAFGEVIPACSNAIIDEAHQLEDVATQYFGFSISNYRLEDFARDAERFAQAESARPTRQAGAHATRGEAVDEPGRDRILKALAEVRDHARRFFTELALAHRGTRERDVAARNPGWRTATADQPWGAAGGREERVRATAESLEKTHETAANLVGALDRVEAALALSEGGRVEGQGESSPADDRAALIRRAGEIRDELRILVRATDPSYVHFVEFRGKGIFLRAAPIDVSSIVRELLLDRMRTTVLTSATLTVDGTFEYIRDRLGVGSADTVRLPSEFDFARQSILYLPPRMPDPGSPDFPVAAGRQVVEILKRTRGRAFVLFTSYATLRVVQAISEMALEYPIFVQGTAPRSQLLRQFRETPHSVLLATSSFWQGVDVVGEALSCVVVDKLPFASPGDPITAARIEAIRARGGRPFEEYQVPVAILTLLQGLGRLIRHRRDRGLLAVLDPRLKTRGYGRRFMASLPPTPVVDDLAAVERFFLDRVK
jgi:ATP-dependent DNA helicase DinG